MGLEDSFRMYGLAPDGVKKILKPILRMKMMRAMPDRTPEQRRKLRQLWDDAVGQSTAGSAAELPTVPEQAAQPGSM